MKRSLKLHNQWIGLCSKFVFLCVVRIVQRHGLIDIFRQEGLFCAKKAITDQPVLAFLSFSNGKKFEQERAVRLPDTTVFLKGLHLLLCGALTHAIRKVRRCMRPFLRLLTFDEGEKLTQSFMCKREVLLFHCLSCMQAVFIHLM